MNRILQVITKYRIAKKWTEYQLADKSGLPQSTISSWYRKNIYPTIPSLMRICDALGISMAQLFNEDEERNILTRKQKDILEKFDKLSNLQQKALIDFLGQL